jgi:hypothetical protein
MKDFLAALETYLENDSDLNYVQSVSTALDWDDLINGSFPFINLEPEGVSYSKDNNFHFETAQKVKYKVLCSLATRNVSYYLSVIGRKDEPGILDLTEDFYASIKGYEAANRRGTSPIQIVNEDINVVQRTYKMNDSGLFVATAELSIDFYITDFL